MSRRLVALPAAVLVVVTACATATPPAGAPKAELAYSAPGSTWVVERKNTGSYGDGAERLTIEALPEQTYHGRKVRPYKTGDTILYVDSGGAGWVARVRGTTPLESFDPPLGFDWPIWVGKTWVRSYNYTDHVKGRSFTGVQGWYKVEGYEDVTVPAGTFKAFKVSFSAGTTQIVSWWQPEWGVTVKSTSARSGQSYLGAGTSETVMISQSIKR